VVKNTPTVGEDEERVEVRGGREATSAGPRTVGAAP